MELVDITLCENMLIMNLEGTAVSLKVLSIDTGEENIALGFLVNWFEVWCVSSWRAVGVISGLFGGTNRNDDNLPCLLDFHL